MSSQFSAILTNFHFIRPLWLFAFIALFIGLYLLKKLHYAKSGWQQLLPEHLLKSLLENSQDNQLSTQTKRHNLLLPFIIGCLTIIALAGPTWQKLPQPVYQIERGSVLIMDMSYSMYATDILPNRLTRAKFKASDLLEKISEGDVGLVAYAGDAFIISPLTEDINNIKLLLPSLSPDIMPSLGSNPISALMLADEMLKNAGHIEGDIYWFTDGIDAEDIQDITEWSRNVPHQLNILGIGTKNGAPIKLPQGELLKDSSGAIIVPKLSISYLRGVANRGHGSYQTISNDTRDIDVIAENRITKKNEKQSKSLNLGDQYKEAGPYLVLLILPLLLSYFRRGNFLLILPFCLLLLPSHPVSASLWQDLWQTKDQQAQKKFNQQSYQAAAEQFNSKNWQASAHYKAGDYQQALAAYKASDPEQTNDEALYNQGNAHAQLQQYDQAIKAYEKALKINPENVDAQKNKTKIEALKQQQDQQNKQDQKDQEQQSSDQNKKDQQQNNEQGDSQDQEQSQQQKDQQSKADSDSEKENQSDSEQNSDPNNDAKNDQQENQEPKEQQNEQAQAKQQNDDKEAGQKQQAQKIDSEQQKLDQELAEKHQQLLNKVTDDPYLLLRNKMKLEYQKRSREGQRSGVSKQW